MFTLVGLCVIGEELKEGKSLSHARLFANPWAVACTKLLCPWDILGKNTGFPFPSPGDLPTPRIKSMSHAWRMADSLPLSHLGSPGPH